MTELTPRTQTELFGHEDIEAMLLADARSGKLAHGIIFSGPRGIGKATLAYRFARALLGQGAQEPDAVFHRIAAHSHADLLVIEPLYDPKKDELAREITVEQARTIAGALSLTPGEGQWRVVIIDSIDALNPNAANAILKILEEPPPQTVLMLISHAPGRLLPTIRSRCRMLAIPPLSHEDFNRVLRRAQPELYGPEAAMLAMLSSHSPGVALELHAQEAPALYTDMLEMLAACPQLDMLRVHRFAEQIGSGKQHANWQVFTTLALCLLSRVAKQAAGCAVEAASPQEAHTLATLAALHNAESWAIKWQQAANQLSLAAARHLDYKQVALTFFHSLAGSDEFTLAAA